MKKYALIGRSLSHSQSRRIHAQIGDYDYNQIELAESGELEALLSNTEYRGFNVTNPYKIEVIKHLDELSDDAKRIGAVNTIMRLPDGRLKGFNTDLEGFKYTARGNVEDRKCLVLGSGGSARSAAAALKDLGASEVVIISRDPDAAADDLKAAYCVSGYNRLYLHYDARVIVNATTVGQLPDIEHSPVTDQRLTVRMFSNLELAIDLIYNPYRTKFLQDARRLTGCHTKSGLEMLIVQAVVSRNIWLDLPVDEDEIKRLVTSVKRRILEGQLNVIAIGMPGSGKTTIFRRYAYELGLKFIDTDEETEKIMGDSVQNVLSSGEPGIEYFRAMEHIAVREACKHSGAVIATGGGTVLNPLNRDFLRSNGIVVYVRRPLELLDIKGRPLSISRGVAELFGERERIYRRVSDLSIVNSRIFGGVLRSQGDGGGEERRDTRTGRNTFNYDLKGFVYYKARKLQSEIN